MGEVGGRITSLYLPSPHQSQLPQQKIQLQEACMRKEKSVALLEHQLLEVEVRDSSQQSPGNGGPGWGSPAIRASADPRLLLELDSGRQPCPRGAESRRGGGLPPERRPRAGACETRA